MESIHNYKSKMSKSVKTIKESVKVVSGFGIPILGAHWNKFQQSVRKMSYDPKIQAIKYLTLKPSCNNAELMNNVAAIHDSNNNTLLLLRNTIKIYDEPIDTTGAPASTKNQCGSVLIGPLTLSTTPETRIANRNYDGNRRQILRTMSLSGIENSCMVSGSWLTQNNGFIPIWAFSKNGVRLASLIGNYKLYFSFTPKKGIEYL